MKLNKLKTNRIILSALCMVFMCCAILGYTLLSQTAGAIDGVPSSTTVGRLYNFDNYSYDSKELDNLAKAILPTQNGSNASTVQFQDLVNYATSSQVGTNGVPVKSKDITVKYGRYRFTESSSASYNDLVWMPVYISRSTNGDAILTMYLAGTTDLIAAAVQEKSAFIGTSPNTVPNTAKEYASSSPSNSYGTSWMRAVGTGAGSDYASYGPTTSLNKAQIKSSNKFADFVKSDVLGEFYDDIATPSEIAWQGNQSYAANSSKFTTIGSGNANFNWPNEAYSTPSTGDYSIPGYFNYASKAQYTDWQYDKVWLPSLTEVGDGDTAPSGPSTYSGLWELSKYQRANDTYGSWLRSAKTVASRDGNAYSAYTMFIINADGTIGESDVNQIRAIRPAIHVNLTKIKDGGKTTPALRLPETITSTYKGDSLGQSIADVSDDQKTWYTPNASKLHIEFWSDENCTRRVQPIDAGTYYMMVTITDSSQGSLRFYNADPKYPNRKVIKFVIQKAKLQVDWEKRTDPENSDSGTNEIPIKVKYKDGTTFYPRDKGFEPELGFYYMSREGGTRYYDGEYPERIGTYYAYAYIKNESAYNYNYELETTNYAHRSGAFYMGPRSFPIPEFCFYSDDAVVSADKTQLDLPYKGKNYVQIRNITSKMIVTVTASSEAAQNSIVDLGLNDEGIKTYQVSNIGQYTFNVALSATEKANGHWKSNNPNANDTADKKLWLNIKQAVVTATFEGLPTSWDSLSDQSFTLNLVGVQDNDNLEMTVSYVKSGGVTTELIPDANGRYVIRERNVGEYTVIAVIAGSAYDDIPYIMMSPAVQKFTITQATSSFRKEFISWQYTEGGLTTFIDVGEGSTPTSPIQVEYTGNFYEFSLQIDEARLRDSYLVRASYTSSAYVKNAGTYNITVTISAYDKNVYFETITDTIYVTINPGHFDMSEVKWNHPENVSFKYDASNTDGYEVLLVNVPDGLIVTYVGNKASNIGTFRAEATFSISEEFEKNYAGVPDPMFLNWSVSESGNTTDKKDYNTSFLTLTVTHGSETVGIATWNSQQKKWFEGSKEFVLSFPYDGTEYKLVLAGEVTGVTWLPTPSNNAFTNAGEYEAIFHSSYDAAYGEPEFAKIQWTIAKAEIDFSNVRWGYIDEHGNEYDIDFDNNPFIFTVNEGSAVRYTVGLIGLPEGIRVNYTTDSLTEANSKGMSGNTFADIGEYETRLNRSVLFNNSAMASNYATTRIPVTISSVQYWKIAAREYVPLSYDGSWSMFDNRTHNLIDLCNIPASQLDYFRVEIIFLDRGNNLDQQYAGYEGQAFYGYHAGNYILRFYEYRGINDDGSLKEFFWGSVEIDVKRADLSVTWDEKGAIPVARVTGMNISGMIETKYTDTNNMTVNEAYIKTRPGVTFFAEAKVTDQYKNDLRIVMENNASEKLEFVYDAPPITTNAQQIDPNKIVFVEQRKEYTGRNITFSLKDWNVYANYLYIEGDSFTQLRAGEYVVYISFLKNADAFWLGTNQNRDTIERHFFIDAPTSFALDYPVISADASIFSYSEDGIPQYLAGRPITFSIDNWEVLQDFVTFTVKDRDGKEYGDWLTYNAISIYTITFSIPTGSIGHWKETANKEEYVYTFELISPNRYIDTPKLVESTQSFTGQSITFRVDNDNYFRTFCDYKGDDLTQIAIGNYRLILEIKPQYDGLKFANESTLYTLNFSISASSTTPPPASDEIATPKVVASTPAAPFTGYMEYTGNEINIIENWSEISQYVDAGIISADGAFTSNAEAYIIWKEVGAHVIHLRIKPEYVGKMKWQGGSTDEIIINFTIAPATVDIDKSGVGTDGKFTGPNKDNKDVNFDDFFDYTYYDKDGNEVSRDDLKDGEDYTVKVTLKPDKEADFKNTFENADDILKAIEEHGPYSFTYDSGEFDTRILIIIIIAEVAVLVFLIIATIIVLLVQNKTLKEMENEYDRYEDYEDDDDDYYDVY